MIKRLLIIFLVLIIPSISSAERRQAVSNSSADVQAEITAASDGDIIEVPVGTGSVEWSTTVVLDGNKTLMGPGYDKLIIVDKTPSPITRGNYNTHDPAIKITGNGRVSGFRFSSSGNYADVYDGVVSPYGTTQISSFRIDNCYFDSAGNGIIVWKYAYGLIDNCIFNSSAATNYVSVMGDTSAAWLRPLTLGSANAVYVEDCTFSKPSGVSKAAIYGQDGARYVFRKNAVTNMAVDVHGHCGGQSTYSFEIYNNIFTYPYANSFGCIGIRGGTGVIYNNSLFTTGSGSLTNKIILMEYRINAKDSCNSYPTCCLTTEGYPCLQQVGQTYDTDTSSMTTYPVYIWGNTFNGSAITASVYDVVGGTTGICDLSHHVSEVIQLDRDYKEVCIQTEKVYTPYTYPHPLRGKTPETQTPCSGVTTTTTSVTGTTTSSSTSTIWPAPIPSTPTGFKVRKKT